MSIVGSWELDSCSEPTMWAPLARAYLDASAHLCEAMISGTFPRTYSHGITILGLAHHSVELFYKGVIHVNTGKMPSSTHNLHTLEKCVKQIAPDIEGNDVGAPPRRGLAEPSRSASRVEDWCQASADGRVDDGDLRGPERRDALAPARAAASCSLLILAITDCQWLSRSGLPIC